MPAPDAALRTLIDALALALRGAGMRIDGLAVGFSAGADSAMLALAAWHYTQAHGQPLHLFHIHHGLVDTADAWADAAQRFGEQLGVPVEVMRVQVAPAGGLGIEAAARDARYAALGAAAARHGVSHILLAHHRDDQAETVLLRLLRGAGLKGLAAMAPTTMRDGVAYLRPWLDIDRGVILQAMDAYTLATGWMPVQDPSNADPRYTRAAVRTLLAPVLDARWTGWRGTLARHARHVADAVQILDEVAREDFAGLSPTHEGRRFSLAAWRRLSRPRQAQALRYWLDLHGARMPSDARLQALMRSLNELHALGHDRELLFDHGGHRIRCVRGEVILQDRPSAP
jgi:tRNA(Ile)-lysidine synthase